MNYLLPSLIPNSADDWLIQALLLIIIFFVAHRFEFGKEDLKND